MRIKTAVISIVTLAALTACSGGSSPTNAKSTQTSPSASVSPTETASTSAAGQLAGAWVGSYTSNQNGSVKGGFTLIFTERGSKLSGTITLDAGCFTNGTVSGTVTGNSIDFGAVKAAGGSTVSFTGSVAPTKIQGTYRSGGACGNDNGTWTAARS